MTIATIEMPSHILALLKKSMDVFSRTSLRRISNLDCLWAGAREPDHDQ